MAEIDDSLERLPHTYEKRKDESNFSRNLWKVLSIFTTEIDILKQIKEKIVIFRDIDKATGRTLDYIGANVQQWRGKTIDSVYRALIKTKIARNINKGDLNGLISTIAVTVNCPKSEVKIREYWENNPPEAAAISISVPDYALNNIAMTPAQFTALMEKIVAAGVRIDGLYRGSFHFSSIYDQPVTDSDHGFDVGTLSAYYSTISGGDELPI